MYILRRYRLYQFTRTCPHTNIFKDFVIINLIPFQFYSVMTRRGESYHLFSKLYNHQRTCTVEKGAQALGGSKYQGMRSDGRGRVWGRLETAGGREGQSLWNWFCFLYVSDVLRLPAPPCRPPLLRLRPRNGFVQGCLIKQNKISEFTPFPYTTFFIPELTLIINCHRTVFSFLVPSSPAFISVTSLSTTYFKNICHGPMVTADWKADL